MRSDIEIPKKRTTFDFGSVYLSFVTVIVENASNEYSLYIRMYCEVWDKKTEKLLSRWKYDFARIPIDTNIYKLHDEAVYLAVFSWNWEGLIKFF